MKKITTIIILILSIQIYGQVTLAPAKGDRASYYLVDSKWGDGGKVWETEFDYSSPIILKSFRDDESEVYWIQRLSMQAKEFERLMNYLENNGVGIGGITKTGTMNNYQLSGFDIYFDDLGKTMSKIKNFFVKCR